MKTYSRHCQLIDDMAELIPIKSVSFDYDYWRINNIKFKPVLHNPRKEKVLNNWMEEFEDYRFEASAKENIKVYQEEKALEMDKRSKIPFYKKWQESQEV